MKQYRKTDLGPECVDELKAALTFQDTRNENKLVRGRPVPVPFFSAYAENEHCLRVPKFFPYPISLKSRKEPDYSFQPGLVNGDPVEGGWFGNPGFDSELRPIQAQALDILLERLERATSTVPQGATLCLPCGFGKTRTAIFAIHRLRAKTLVLASHSHLLVQFSKEASRIASGVVVAKLPKSPAVPLDPTAHIIFGTLQSIYCRNYPASYWASIGLVIVDEAHHLAAPTFCQALCRLPVCRVLALTATPERKDGREALRYYLAGDTAFRAYRPKSSLVTVKYLRYTVEDPDTLKPFQTSYNTVGERMVLLGKMSLLQERNAVLVAQIQKLASGRAGVLVLCKLINHLHQLAEACALPDYGFFTGQETQPQREEAAQRLVIFATFDMAKEGLGIPRLDALVLGSPAENTIQCMGRILREVPGKLDPLVVDVYDDCVAFRGEVWSRLRQYTETGARIVGISKVK